MADASPKKSIPGWRATYVGPDWIREMARQNPHDAARWNQIADECPPDCSIKITGGEGGNYEYVPREMVRS